MNVETLKKRYPQIVDFYFVSSYNGTGIDELSKEIAKSALDEKYMVLNDLVHFYGLMQ